MRYAHSFIFAGLIFSGSLVADSDSRSSLAEDAKEASRETPPNPDPWEDEGE